MRVTFTCWTQWQASLFPLLLLAYPASDLHVPETTQAEQTCILSSLFCFIIAFSLLFSKQQIQKETTKDFPCPIKLTLHTVHRQHLINYKWPFDWLNFLKYSHRFCCFNSFNLGQHSKKSNLGFKGCVVELAFDGERTGHLLFIDNMWSAAHNLRCFSTVKYPQDVCYRYRNAKHLLWHPLSQLRTWLSLHTKPKKHNILRARLKSQKC